MRYSITLICLLLSCLGFKAQSQELYSARGYWVESTKANYLSITQRLTRGDSLTTNELTYLKDYETYLANYLQRMPEEEKQEYNRMKEQWNKELVVTEITPPTESKVNTSTFEWRGRDRIVNAGYGIYYGTSFVLLADIIGPGAAGIPLITGGLSLLGPALNPKKYEGITRNTIRAGNTGKLLGLGYGAALGLTLGGETENSYKWVLGLSSIGSIALGETAFQLQKKRNNSIGQIEMMRHYGILIPLVGMSLTAAAHVDNPNLNGFVLLAGGVSGLMIGNKVSKKYDYSQGDVDAVSSLTLVSAGMGFAIVGEALNNNSDPNSLLLVPAAGAIIGTLASQKAVRGVHLTNKQGSTISLSTAGAALIGFGIAAIAQSDSPAVIIGVPSVLALITHQMLFHKFKMKNLEVGLLKGSEKRKNNYKLAFNVTPENYLLNKKIPIQNYSPQSYSKLQNPLFSLKFTF